MSPKDTVTALYAAYRSGDPDRITALLHDDVVWVAPAGNATQVALGVSGTNHLSRDFIVQFMVHNMPRLFRDVKNEFRAMAAEGNTVFTEHRLSAVLPDGRPYVNDYCFAYEVKDGRVIRIREYMDTLGGWAQVFGGGPARTLVEFVHHPAAGA